MANEWAWGGSPVSPSVRLNPPGVPAELRALPHWVAWKLLPPKRPGGRPDKVPIDPKTGGGASTTDDSTWGAFDVAVATASRLGLAGVGFVFTGSGLTGIDLDHCVDLKTGEIQPAATALLDEFSTYAEFSPSGTGIHLIAKGVIAGRGINQHGIEIYSTGRFFTVTGVPMPGAPTEIAERQVEINHLYLELSNKKQKAKPKARGTIAPVVPAREAPRLLDDDELVARARGAHNGAKFEALWSGDTSSHKSASEADLALCAMLAFWTGKDAQRVDRLFRRSGLYRPKWDEQRGDKTYGQHTVERACAGSGPTFGEAPIIEAHASGSPSRRVINVIPGELPETTNAAQEVLRVLEPPQIFQRERHLVRLSRMISVEVRDGTERPSGAVVLTHVEPAYLVDLLTRVSCWVRATKKGPRPIDAPMKVAQTILARSGAWPFPPLRAVIEAPTLRRDGSSLETPGYDPSTQLYFDAGACTFPRVPTRPTRNDALRALAVFEPVLSGFPFVAPFDRSAALCALFTPLVRRSLPTAPLHAIRAPTMGSGKSLLVDVAGYLATGRVVPVMTQGRDNDEQQKRMLAVLMEGDALNSIDNIERPLGDPDLCTILTQEMYQGRLLGSTQMVRVPTCTTWFATGNNLQIEGDLTSRCVLCDLDPRVENPEKRRFAINLREYVPAHRGELVVAALTVMRAYIVAGRPDVGLEPFGRFEQWSDLVRASLVWLGLPDPLLGAQRLQHIDPVKRTLRALLTAWRRQFDTRPASAAMVVTHANREPNSALAHALAEALNQNPGELKAQALGIYLRRFEGRLETSLKIEKAGESGGSATWRVVSLEGGPGGPRGPSPATREEKTITQGECVSSLQLGGKAPHLPQVPLSSELQVASECESSTGGAL